MKTIWFKHPDSGQEFDVVKGTVAERYARQQGCTVISDPSGDQAPKSPAKPKAPKSNKGADSSTNPTDNETV